MIEVYKILTESYGKSVNLELELHKGECYRTQSELSWLTRDATMI